MNQESCKHLLLIIFIVLNVLFPIMLCVFDHSKYQDILLIAFYCII